jgi:hypothetical protein
VRKKDFKEVFTLSLFQRKRFEIFLIEMEYSNKRIEIKTDKTNFFF